jgi:Berberine and berberine like
MRFYREFLPAAPRERNGFFATMTVPPAESSRASCSTAKGAAWCGATPGRRRRSRSCSRLCRPWVVHDVAPMRFPRFRVSSDYWEATHPYSAGGAYVNMMMDEGQERERASYRDNYDRLAAAKATYGPTHALRVKPEHRAVRGDLLTLPWRSPDTYVGKPHQHCTSRANHRVRPCVFTCARELAALRFFHELQGHSTRRDVTPGARSGPVERADG